MWAPLYFHVHGCEQKWGDLIMRFLFHSHPSVEERIRRLQQMQSEPFNLPSPAAAEPRSPLDQSDHRAILVCTCGRSMDRVVCDKCRAILRAAVCRTPSCPHARSREILTCHYCGHLMYA